MQVQLLLTVFVVALDTIFAADINSACVTPNEENATCIPIRSCKVILDALSTNTDAAIDFAKKSQCGYGEQPLVCCGSSGYSILDSIFDDIFTEKPQTTAPAQPLVAKAPLLGFSIHQQLPNRTVCGLGVESYRVIGGSATEINEFPWMAALEYNSTRTGENAGIRCGGSIINDKYVLTTAHCIIGGEFEVISVWLGEWKISTDPDCEEYSDCADPVQKFKIEDKIPHQFYSKKSGDNDIGLLKLQGVIKYSEYIRPICMPPPNLQSPVVGTYMTVAGWGATEDGTSSDVKLKVKLPLITNKECKEKFENQAIGINQLCAGGEKGKDTCRGDSGGPLMRVYEDDDEHPNQWYQEGVVAWGVGCGRPGFPAIYTRVTRYIGWIITNIKEYPTE